jgi:4'-phosphopantetheinyl transferase
MHALRSILAQDEVERAERYRSAEDRDRFVFARGLLRFILGRYLAMPPEKVQIQCGPLGKVAERTSLRFSVSHSSVLVLYALAHARHVGIELEHVRLLSEVRTLVERFFSATEQAAFSALPREDQLLVAL